MARGWWLEAWSTVIPRADIDVRQQVDGTRLCEPDGETVRYPSWLGTQREYSAVFYNEASWDEAARALAEERRVLVAADAAADDAEEFDEFAYEQFEAEGAMHGYLELGVTGLVYALNASGCVTASCCRGHAESGCGIPQVLLACDSRRASLLLPLARRAGCALENFDGGGLVVYAPSVAELVSLGELMVEHRSDFDPLALPAVRGRFFAADDDVDVDAQAELGADDMPPDARPRPGQQALF